MRILIVSYYFPPYMNVGGLRPLSWARAFHDAGHDVTVIRGDGQASESCSYFPEETGRDLRVLLAHNPRMAAVSPTEQIQVRGPGKGNHVAPRVKDFLKKFVPIVDLFGTWARVAGALVDAEITERGPFDAIISTSFPLSTHKVARRAQRGHGSLWVADFRDYFGQFESTRLSRLTPRTWRIRSFVRRVGQGADLVTTVSRELETLLGRTIPGKSIEVYYNGYFEEHLPDPRPRKIERRILYTGSYNAKEFTLAPLVEALVCLKAQGVEPPVLCFAGGRIESLALLLTAAGLPHEFLPSMPNREILRLQAESSMLLLCDAMSGPGVLLTKTFEYLAAKRPIIVITRPGSELATTLFSRPSAAYLLSMDAEEIGAFIKKMLIEDGRGAEAGYLEPALVKRYSREAQAVKLLGRIEELGEARA